MTERDRKTVYKLLHHIGLVQEYMKSIRSVDEFKVNSLVRDAVVFNLLQLGELAKNHLTEDFKRKTKSIPWNNIYGLRNRIVHDYYGVELNTLYGIIKGDIETLKSNLSDLIISLVVKKL